MMDAPLETLAAPLRAALEKGLLASWLPRQRWFRSKGRAVASVAIEAAFPVTSDATFSVVRVEFTQGDPERYVVPLALVAPERAADFPEAAVAGAAPDGRLFVDAVHVPEVRAALLDLLAGRREAAGEGGLLRGRPDSPGIFAEGAFADVGRPESSRLYAGEQSNTSFNFDARVVVKLFRRIESGVHPEPEMLRFLRRAGYRGAPVFLSTLEWVPGKGTEADAPVALAVAQEFVRDAALAWDVFVRELSASADAGAGAPEALLKKAATLGASVGALHAALASRPDDPDFAREPLTAADLDAARAGSLARLEAASGLLDEEVVARLREKLRDVAPAGEKIRVHGDLHLGQILLAQDGPRLLDFEGEPGRPLAEARRKASPLRDAAGMLRSFHYAAHVVERTQAGDAAERPESGARADRVANALGAAFRDAWFEAIEGARLFPARASGRAEVVALLNFFILEKALYELEYERNNRPDWIDIPRRGLRILAS